VPPKMKGPRTRRGQVSFQEPLGRGIQSLSRASSLVYGRSRRPAQSGGSLDDVAERGGEMLGKCIRFLDGRLAQIG
jgi:hypothetical protein